MDTPRDIWGGRRLGSVPPHRSMPRKQECVSPQYSLAPRITPRSGSGEVWGFLGPRLVFGGGAQAAPRRVAGGGSYVCLLVSNLRP